MATQLSLRDLRVWFPLRAGVLGTILGKPTRHVRAVDGISFNVEEGEVFCLVGESGCGKTTTGKSLLRLNNPTSGVILFDMPAEDQARLKAIQSRLEALRPELERLTPDRAAQAEAGWSRLSDLKSRLERTTHPARTSRKARRRARAERIVAYLEGRAGSLARGDDAAIRRLEAKEKRRIELLRTRGSWFTPRRAARVDHLEFELKEARFQLLRAEVTHGRTGGAAREVRRLERRLNRLHGRERANEPTAMERAVALEAELSKKRREAESSELENVRAELERRRAKLAASASREGRMSPAAMRELEASIEALRAQGGPGVEAKELEAERTALIERYDLASWGVRGRLPRRELNRRMRRLRRQVQMIYQDPYESLNPKMSIFDIVSEPLLANRMVSTPMEAEPIVRAALEDVGLRPASEYMFRYPHELSGGQRQRVGVAAALVVDPDFIVADEPVSMLDASVRTEILAMLLELKTKRHLTYLFITHDLGLAWILADRLAVMYLGKIVEMGNGQEIIRNPRHPYTKALISVVPSPNPEIQREKIILQGERPDPIDIPPGCRFHPRCPVAVGICGWNSEEVQEDIQRLLREDGPARTEVKAFGSIERDGPFALRIASPDPGVAQRYLRARIEALASARPALASIREMVADGGELRISLHDPTEPPLREIRPDLWVACHLVEPDLGDSAVAAAAEPEAVGTA